jgi:molybdate transport system substrate-binding protein
MVQGSHRRLYSALILCITIGLLPAAQAGGMKLALANSTCAAMQKVGELYRASRTVELSYICKSSGLLAKGLSGGALEADIFISANRRWMDFVVANDLVASDQVVSPWGNVLVVATPINSALQQLSWQELASDKVAKILFGDPSTAPFGRHAKEALKASGLWNRVRGKVETRKNIELLATSLGDASSGTVGILFQTNLTDRLRQLLVVDKDLHKPIRYYMAPLKTRQGNADVQDFIEFMQSGDVNGIFEAAGYVVGAP